MGFAEIELRRRQCSCL